MKKALIIMFLVVGAFLIAEKSFAEELYQDASLNTPLSGLCLKTQPGGGLLYEEDDAQCVSERQPFVDTTMFQELRTTPGISISAVSLFTDVTESNGGNRPATWTAYLMNGNDKVATSTAISWTAGGASENKFNFTPYAVTASTPVDGVAFEFNRDDAFPLFDTGKMNIRLTPNRYPPDYINPAFYSGGYVQSLATGSWYGSIAQLSEFRDFAIRVYIADAATPLEITYPENNSTKSDIPQVIAGTCTNDFDLEVFDGITSASSTNAFGSSILCGGDEAWSWSFNPTQGFWNITASSSGEFDGVVFYYLAQSRNPNPITTTSTNPFATSTSLFFDALGCSSEAQLSLLCTFAERLGTGRPFSYFPQIIGATWSSMDNATRTDWIQPIELSNGFFIPGIRGDILDAVPTEFKNIMRPITTIGVGVFVLLFIWSLRKKII